MFREARQNEESDYPEEGRDSPARPKWNHAPDEAIGRVPGARTLAWRLAGWRASRIWICCLCLGLPGPQTLQGTNYAVGATSASAGCAAERGFWRRLRIKARRRRLETRRAIFDQNAA